jgi:hypothetical protein
MFILFRCNNVTAVETRKYKAADHPPVIIAAVPDCVSEKWNFPETKSFETLFLN